MNSAVVGLVGRCGWERFTQVWWWIKDMEKNRAGEALLYCGWRAAAGRARAPAMLCATFLPDRALAHALQPLDGLHDTAAVPHPVTPCSLCFWPLSIAFPSMMWYMVGRGRGHV